MLKNFHKHKAAFYKIKDSMIGYSQFMCYKFHLDKLIVTSFSYLL